MVISRCTTSVTITCEGSITTGIRRVLGIAVFVLCVAWALVKSGTTLKSVNLSEESLIHLAKPEIVEATTC